MWRYVYESRYVPGVPARDLTDEEWAALTDEERELAARLYEHEPDEEIDDGGK